MRPSYVYNGNPYAGKMASLYGRWSYESYEFSISYCAYLPLFCSSIRLDWKLVLLL